MFSIIAAVAENNAIGKDNTLPWRIPRDLAYFKEITLGKTIIMGRKTFQSLPKVLPDRKHIVLTTNTDFTHEGIEVSNSFEATLLKYHQTQDEAFFIGGADIYKKALPFCRYLYITRIKKSFDADCFFPDVDLSNYEIEEQSPVYTDENSGIQFEFIKYLKPYAF